MSPRGKRKTKRGKAGYMISAVAEMYKIHPQTLRLYEREGLLKPSRSQGNTRYYTTGDLEWLDVILNLTRRHPRRRRPPHPQRHRPRTEARRHPRVELNATTTTLHGFHRTHRHAQ